MTTVHFQNGGYVLNICLDELPKLTLAKTRKLFREMRAGSDVETIMTVRAFLGDSVRGSKEVLAQATSEYMSGQQSVRSVRARDPKALEALQENKRLTEAVKRAKAYHNRWVRIKAIWVETAPPPKKKKRLKKEIKRLCIRTMP